MSEKEPLIKIRRTFLIPLYAILVVGSVNRHAMSVRYVSDFVGMAFLSHYLIE